MIITTLMGGLGNQMFQYAVGRTVSLRTGRRLILDTLLLPSPANGGLRKFGLRELAIEEGASILRRLGPGRHRPPSGSIMLLRRVILSSLARQRIIEPLEQDEFVDLSSVPAHLAILFGYWQSPRYFVGHESELRAELTPPIPVDSPVIPILRGLEDRDVISLHIRRGDYVTDQRIARSHGTQPVDYYTRAGNLVAETCDAPIFVVLSDDPTWAAEHLAFDAPMVHAELQAPLSAIESLALMSRARHAVIANSTLSWWGAWLAEHPEQIVFAPRRWFLDREIDPAHRFPPAWRLL